MNQFVLNYFTTIYLTVNKFSNYKNKVRATKDVIISQIASTLFAIVFPVVLYFLRKLEITFSNKFVPIVVICTIFIVLVIYPLIKYVNKYFNTIDITLITSNLKQSSIKGFFVALFIVFHPLLTIFLLIFLSISVWDL